MVAHISRALSAAARVVAPTIFDPRVRARLTFGPPITPKLTRALDSFNLVTNQVQLRLSQEGQEALKTFAEATDALTDVIGTLGGKDRLKAVAQLQEILDLPTIAVTQAWIQTLGLVIQSNKAVIASIKKRRGK